MSAATPRISVIIPNWNRAHLLPATLDSFLNQTLPPYEIIVADDKSTDHYQEVVEAYKDRVIFIDNKGHGPGWGRNSGLEIATGDYIKFFDSDDVLTLNSLEVQYQTLIKSGKGLVYSPYVHANQLPDGSWKALDPVLQFNPIPASATIRQCMVRGFFTVIPGFLFERKWLDGIGIWRTDISAYEDWDLLWRIGGVEHNPPHTNACCLIYRYHGAQTTGSNQNNLIRDRQKIICYRDAETKVRKSELGRGYSGWDRTLLRAQIRTTLALLQHEPEYAHMFKAYDTPIIRFATKYLRAINKLNRIQTKSNWQKYHGANADPAVFDRYVSML